MCAMAFVGCSDDDDNDGGEDNSKSKIVMEAFDSISWFRLGTSKPGEIVKIDWGDGSTVEEYKTDEKISIGEEDFKGYEEYGYYLLEIKHDYANKSKRTITIESEGIIHFDCWSDDVSFLDVTRCTSLCYLACSEGSLTSLDLTKCPSLLYLNCDENNLTTLDLTKCTNLVKIMCSKNNFTSLDFSKCTALATFYCDDNYNLNSINASGCTVLDEIDIYGVDNLTSINASGCTALEYIWCSGNKLTFLDVSGCTALIKLTCDNNKLNVSALNKIYEDLPRINGSIWAYNNPGYAASNKQIAINKGWTFKKENEY